MPRILRSRAGRSALLALVSLCLLVSAPPARAGSPAGTAAGSVSGATPQTTPPGVAGQTQAQRMRQQGQVMQPVSSQNPAGKTQMQRLREEGKVMQPASPMQTGNETMQRCNRFAKHIAEVRAGKEAWHQGYLDCMHELAQLRRSMSAADSAQREQEAQTYNPGTESGHSDYQEHRYQLKAQECQRQERRYHERGEELDALLQRAYHAGCKDAATPPPASPRPRVARPRE